MINIRKILVATDLSDLSLAAIGYGIALAKKNAAEVSVLHVLPHKAMQEDFSDRYVTDEVVMPTSISVGGRSALDHESFLETKKRVVHDFLEEKIGHELLSSVKINLLIRFGKTGKEIVAAAKEEGSDLIVMTSRGSRLMRIFGSSISEWVAEHAPCPFVCIQPSAEVRTEEDNRVPVTLVDKWAA
jgi:nucleotide-binding universal stress UspA family protein